MRRIRTILFLLTSLSLITFTACQPDTTSTNTLTPNDSTTPMLTVREATNCRVGPGDAYEIIFTSAVGTKFEIVGRYDARNFWLVKSAESPAGSCWMWGGSVDVTGNYAAVPVVTPVSTASRAATLIVDQWEYSCDSGTLTFTLNWIDRAVNEIGYRVFRDGQLLVELPANSTTYKDSFSVTTGQNVEYYLQVFSPDGSLNSPIMTASC